MVAQAVQYGRRIRRKVPSWLIELGPEKTDGVSEVYLLTFARVLAQRLQRGDLEDVTQMSRAGLLDCVLDSWERPLTTGAGRPRESAEELVKKVVVYEEAHNDGTKHFHVAVLLGHKMRFAACKRTLLERHGLVAHFSATHTQWWSAVRYGKESPKKLEPDPSPLRWVPPGHPPIDLFEDSQQPFQAAAWRKRREHRDDEAATEGRNHVFTKLDFTALVLDKGLETKAAVLRYVKQRGTVAMQAFCNRHQRKLDEFLEDASEWNFADETAAAEEQTDWALVAAWAEKPCPKGDHCEYCVAAKAFFCRNACNFTQADLAEALRRIIISGPGKDARVPFLVGSTNTGKSSLIESFDQLFGARRVYHLPAVTDVKYALRNWLKNKRFVLWDEFSPVEFATLGVLPVTQFKKAFNGQWFEIQVPQGHHDGNKDFQWKRGAVFANKCEDLWTPHEKVGPEDIEHLKSRVRLFHCTSAFKKVGESKPEIPQCAHHLAKWLCEGAVAFDARSVLARPQLGAGTSHGVQGLAALLSTASLPADIVSQLQEQVEALGALHVLELAAGDWATLPVWGSLLEMQKRRLCRAIENFHG